MQPVEACHTEAFLESGAIFWSWTVILTRSPSQESAGASANAFAGDRRISAAQSAFSLSLEFVRSAAPSRIWVSSGNSNIRSGGGFSFIAPRSSPALESCAAADAAAIVNEYRAEQTDAVVSRLGEEPAARRHRALIVKCGGENRVPVSANFAAGGAMRSLSARTASSSATSGLSSAAPAVPR